MEKSSFCFKLIFSCCDGLLHLPAKRGVLIALFQIKVDLGNLFSMRSMYGRTGEVQFSMLN